MAQARSCLAPHRTAGKALTAGSQKSYVHGVSIRAVDDLVEAMGGSSVSKNEVGRWVGEIDGRASAFLKRPCEGERPYLWIGATYIKAREAVSGRLTRVSRTVRPNLSGGDDNRCRREYRRAARGPWRRNRRVGGRGPWQAFLRSLAARGQRGVRLVIADGRKGLCAAAARVLNGTLRRCRVPWIRGAWHTGPPSSAPAWLPC